MITKTRLLMKTKSVATECKTEPAYHPVEITSRQARFLAEGLVQHSLGYAKKGKVQKELFNLWLLFDHIAELEDK